MKHMKLAKNLLDKMKGTFFRRTKLLFSYISRIFHKHGKKLIETTLKNCIGTFSGKTTKKNKCSWRVICRCGNFNTSSKSIVNIISIIIIIIIIIIFIIIFIIIIIIIVFKLLLLNFCSLGYGIQEAIMIMDMEPKRHYMNLGIASKIQQKCQTCFKQKEARTLSSQQIFSLKCLKLF